MLPDRTPIPPVEDLLKIRPTSWKGLSDTERMAWYLFDCHLQRKLGAVGPPDARAVRRRRTELRRVVEALAPHVREADAVELVRADVEARASATTQFGGLPYMERGEPWPRSSKTGEPLRFLGQIAPVDLPHHPVPNLALVTLFVDEENYLFHPDGDGRDVGVLVARSYAAPSLGAARKFLPAEVPGLLPTWKAATRQILTLPMSGHELKPPLPLGVTALLRDSAAWFGTELWQSALDELKVTRWPEPEVQVGGHGWWWQADWPESKLLLQVRHTTEISRWLTDGHVYVICNEDGTDVFPMSASS